MKKVNLLFCLLSLGIVLLSCNSDEDILEITEIESSLNLRSPNGDKIAPNISSLKEEVSISLAERFGIDKDFNITNLEYASVKEGYAVQIFYTTSEGTLGAVIKTNIMSASYPPDLNVKNDLPRLKKKGDENTASLNGMIITCKNLSDRCSCIPTIKTNTGFGIVFDCGKCDECEMTQRY